jgi:hypothetical protein
LKATINKGHSSKDKQHTCRFKAHSMSNLADHMASYTQPRAGQLARPEAGCGLPSYSHQCIGHQQLLHSRIQLHVATSYGQHYLKLGPRGVCSGNGCPRNWPQLYYCTGMLATSCGAAV